MNTERIFYLVIIAVLLFITGLLYANDGNFLRQNYHNSITDLSGGDYIRFVFIGSHTCPFSNNERTHDMVNYLKKKFEEITKEHSLKFISTGISVDIFPQLGLNYLKQTNPYHEIIAGASVYNLGSVYYSAGSPSTPRVLILHENYETELKGINLNHLNRSQRLVQEYSGVFEIERFFNFVKSSTHEELIDFLDIYTSH